MCYNVNIEKQERKGKGSNMDYKEQIEQAKNAAEQWRKKHPIVGVGELRVDLMVEDITRSITDLLSRAEAAEARCALLDEARENANEACAKWEGVYRMALERAEKAEKERDAAIQTIFQWTGCQECKFWKPGENWCEKHDREACSSDGCDTPEWRGRQLVIK